MHEAVATDAHRLHGAVNPVAWLVHGTGIAWSRARAELATAVAMTASHKVKAAVEEGSISLDHASRTGA